MNKKFLKHLKIMLGIIIVTYKSYDRIQDYVKEDLLGFISSGKGKLIVVDVGSVYSSAERVAGLLDVKVSNFDEEPVGDVIVLHVEENLGYARANNYGVRYLLKHFPETDAFLFSNEDVRFKSTNVLETLLARLKSLPDAGAIGPDVRDMNGNPQGPAFNYQTIWYMIVNNICEPFFGRSFIKISFASGKKAEELERRSGPACVLSGCFLMVDAKSFLEAGMFDERTFLYWEEEILSRRMEAIGKRFYYEDSVQIEHLVGGSTPQKDRPNTFQLKNTIYGANLYFKYYEKCGFMRLLLLRASNYIRLGLVNLAVLKYKIKHML